MSGEGWCLERWLALRRKVREYDRDAEPSVLAPPEAFNDRRVATIPGTRAAASGRPARRPDSPAVAGRIARSCAGWPEPPTTGEFFDAVHAASRTERQASLVAMWVLEAGIEETMQAWADGVYTLREFVRAIHDSGAAGLNPAKNAQLNRFTRG